MTTQAPLTPLSTPPAPPTGSSQGSPPLGGSPLRFLIYWFVVPLVVVLLLQALGLPERFGTWVDSLW